MSAAAKLASVAPPPEPAANVEVEAAYLGAILGDASIDTMAGHAIGLKPDHFYEPAHATIYLRFTELVAKGRPATPPTLRPHLEGDPHLAALGGPAYLARLSGDGAARLDPLSFAQEIVRLARQRAFADTIERALGDARAPDPDFSGIADAIRLAANCAAPFGAHAPLPFEWAGDVQPVLDDFWLVDDFLPKSGPAVLYGHPGSGKTFLALSIAAHVADGKPWAGRHVERGPVVYLVAEGVTGFRNRLSAMFSAGQMSRGAPFAFIPVAIDLQSPTGDVDKLVATVRHLEGRIGSPALIVIDTLSKTFGAGKENTDDMTAYVANCERIASAFDCLTLIVHHRPRNSEGQGERGHSSLRGGVVASVLVEGDQIKTATTVKQKDGPEGERIAFELERIVLGTNSRGKEVTSCLVRMVDADQATLSSIATRHSLTGHYRTAVQVIEQMLETFGENVPQAIPVDAIDRSIVTRVILSGQIRTRLADTLSGSVKADPDKLPDTLRRTVKRVLATLESKEILGSWGEWLWLK